MLEADPFEVFKERRQVELLEARFRERADRRREAVRAFLRRAPSPGVAARAVAREMEAYFTETREHVHRLAQTGLHPQAVERQVQAEMDDFFRHATAAARELVQRLQAQTAGAPDAGAVAETLDRLFADTLAQVEAAAARLARPKVVSLPELVQQLNTGTDRCQPGAAAPPDPQPAPPPQAASAPERPGPAPPPPKPVRRLRRQAHIPVALSRRRGLSPQEVAELRALKELLLEKGILTREELARRARLDR